MEGALAPGFASAPGWHCHPKLFCLELLQGGEPPLPTHLRCCEVWLVGFQGMLCIFVVLLLPEGEDRRGVERPEASTALGAPGEGEPPPREPPGRGTRTSPGAEQLLTVLIVLMTVLIVPRHRARGSDK